MPGLTEIYKSKLRGILIESPVTLITEDAIKSALRRINIEPGYYTEFIERARLKQTTYIDLDKFVKAIPTKPPPPGKPNKPEKSRSMARRSIKKEPSRVSRPSPRKSPRPSPGKSPRPSSGKSPQPSPGKEDSLEQRIRVLKDELKEMEDNLDELSNETGADAAQRTIGESAKKQRINAKKSEIKRATKRMEREKMEREKMKGGYKKTNRRRKINKRTRRCTKRKF